MKRAFKSYFIILLVIILIPSCVQTKPKDGSYSFEIFSTNDIHGRYFDSLYVVGDDGVQTHKSSLASIYTTIDDARTRLGDENVILLDMGDHIQGDNAPFYYSFVDTLSQHIYSRVANFMKYDAVVVGNHDIEVGHSVYDRVAKELNMPYLAANAIRDDNGKPYFEPYTIVERQGIKVAIVGFTNPNVPSWLAPEIWSGMHFQDIVSSLNQWIAYIDKKEKPHIIVVALHSGLGEEDVDDFENVSRYVAKHVEGIDLVFASHDHKVASEKYNNNGKDVWLLEGGSRASNLSQAKVNFNIKDGVVQDLVINGETLSMTGVEAHSQYMSEFRDAFEAVKVFTNTEVGILENDIYSRDAFFGPSAYVDMIHSLQLKATNADVSFAAPLSYNKYVAKGSLNYQDLMDIYPFENQLNVIELSGKEIKDYLEYSYAHWVNKDPKGTGHILDINDTPGASFRLNTPHFNFDSAAGIIYEVDITKPVNERVHIISMANGDSFNMDHKYKVALTSYRASGGGDLLTEGAGIPKEQLQGRIVSRLSDIREILYNQLQQDGTLKANKLNQWRFVPDDLASTLSDSDRALLFGEK